jgi:hypothetical protein
MSPPKTISERRRFLRLPLAIDVYYKAMDDLIDTSGLRASRARNLSPGGLLFRSSFRMKIGTIIQLMLVFADRGRRRRIPALARVAYCQQLSKQRFEIGAGFVDIFPKDLEFLKSLSSRSKS